MSEPVTTWNQILERYDRFKTGQWCFRGDRARDGEADPDRLPFRTSLERAAIDRWRREWSELPRIEAGLLRRFKREAHLYLDHEPAEGDTVGWLALMRHHGAPTRLLDWSFSFFVALYFAIDRADPGESPCVWALNLEKIREAVEGRDHLREHLARDPNAKDAATVRAIIDHTPRHALIYPLNPLRMNRRLVLQQSVFIVPGDITQPFMANLRAVADPADLLVEIRICTEPTCWTAITRELLAMNISSATLFPGLDGFASNLKALIPFPDLRAVDTAVGQE